MADSFRLNRKFLEANFEPAACGELMWVYGIDRTVSWDGAEEGLPYPYWLLVENRTGRVLATIDGPQANQLCYDVSWEGGGMQKYLWAEGAKSCALRMARQILEREKQQIIVAKVEKSNEPPNTDAH